MIETPLGGDHTASVCALVFGCNLATMHGTGFKTLWSVGGLYAS